MSFKQAVVNVESLEADVLCDILFDLDALSVSIEDQHEGTDLEQPIFNEPGMLVEKLWDYSKISVLFSDDVDVDAIMQLAKVQLGRDFQYDASIVDDQDWVRLTQSQFTPIKITDKLYIVPSWHDLPDASAIGIVLDPGLAFGTGSHPTTFMCLSWLTDNITNNKTVLDYGCGSGILAITASKLGAKYVAGVDIDKQAIEASGYNASNNKVAVNFYLPDEFQPHEQFDIVVANILSNPLRMLAPMLATQVKSDGCILLSGILDSQIDELCQIYSKWFSMSVVNVVDGWALLYGKKNTL